MRPTQTQIKQRKVTSKQETSQRALCLSRRARCVLFNANINTAKFADAYMAFGISATDFLRASVAVNLPDAPAAQLACAKSRHRVEIDKSHKCDHPPHPTQQTHIARPICAIRRTFFAHLLRLGASGEIECV